MGSGREIPPPDTMGISKGQNVPPVNISQPWARLGASEPSPAPGEAKAGGGAADPLGWQRASRLSVFRVVLRRGGGVTQGRRSRGWRCLPKRFFSARARVACRLRWAMGGLPAPRPARVARIRRDLRRRISHLAAGLDPSQLRSNPVAGAGFVCSGEPVVWKPFFLPSRVPRCLDMPGLGCTRVCWRAAPGERLGDFAAGSWGKVRSVCLSVPPRSRFLHRSVLLGRIKMVNS